MARYGRILLLAALAGMLITDFDGGPGRSARDRAFRGTAMAAEAGGSSTSGITVTRPVSSAVESLGDVQARAPLLQGPPPRDRHIRFRRIPRAADTGIFTPQLFLSLSPSAPVTDALVSRAPALETDFPGLANPTSGDAIPPDTMGAAGPTHLVSILNSQFGVFTKTGSIVGSPVTLQAFWQSLDNATDTPSQFPFDPKILYDTNSERFVAITIGSLGAHMTTPSWIMIAVSSTSDPTGPNPWVKVAIRADLDNGAVQSFNGADYPGLGVDANNIYVTANMFDNTDHFQYSKVWVVPIDQLLSGAPANLTWTEFRQPPLSGDSMQPAHTFGAAPAEYFIREADHGQLRLATITGGTTWTDLGLIPVTFFVSTSHLPGAPQFGNPNAIDTSDTRLLNAVFRNGSLWTTHNVLGSSGRVEVAWYQITPGFPVSAALGRINDPNRWYYYPSIGVNANGDVAIGFSGSSATEYASAYYTARSSANGAGPAAGVMQPPTLLKTGEAPYFKTLSGTDNRWGDFSATVVDPTDNVAFWTLQEYAESPGIISGELRSRWGTWWGKFRTPVIAAPSLTATSVSSTQVNLSWTMAAGQGQTGFQVEKRLLPGGDFAVIDANLAADNLAYTDNTVIAGNTYSYRVRAFAPGTGPDSYSNEATVPLSGPPPPPVSSGGGGGGGGCSVSNGKNRNEDHSAIATVLVLLLPLPIIGVRRRIQRILALRGFRTTPH